MKYLIKLLNSAIYVPLTAGILAGTPHKIQAETAMGVVPPMQLTSKGISVYGVSTFPFVFKLD